MLITNINKKQLAVSTAIPIIVGGLASLINFNGFKEFEAVNKPAFTPPMAVFPIVWTVLYILMGFSSYLIYKSDSENKKSTLTVYAAQLIVNFAWTCVFFGMQNYKAALLIVLFLIFIVAAMIFLFYKISKKSAYIQIPYLIWLCFASYLNYMVYIMNK